MANINDFGMPFTSQAGDRAYSALDWRSYFNSLLEDGVIGDIGNELKVNPQSTPNKTIYVDTGAVFISGAMRVMADVTNLTVADNTSGQPRIDRVVAKFNLTNRKIEFAVRQGSSSDSPSPPDLIQNSSTWELSLAQIYLANGFSTITTGVITDERDSVEVCGFFRYRAKPAWYPEVGIPTHDAWMYSTFKEQLTASEISDIEGNSSLMSIILSANKVKNIFPSIIPNALQLYSPPSATISSDITLTEKINIYHDLTVNSGVTLTCTSGTTILIVLGTLALNGIINASEKGGAGGAGVSTYDGAGGIGGGIIYLFVNKITGTGFIKANGGVGESPTTEYSGTSSGGGRNAGTAGSFINNSVPAGSRAHKTSLISFLNFEISSIGGSGGYSGEHDGDGTNASVANGGNGVYASGGGSAELTASGDFSGAGGGGGGGAVIIVSTSGIPTITIEAKGGDAGSCAGMVDSVGGSGGGGGLISLSAPASAAITSASGGAGGINGTFYGNSVNASGSAGLVEFYTLDLLKGV
jgi:hypothetical protein